MNLKKRIKQSGLSYFETHAPDVPTGQKTLTTEEIALSPVFATPKNKKNLIWSLSSLGTAAVGVAVVAVIISLAGPGGARGIDALNAVTFPESDHVSTESVSVDHVNHIRDFAVDSLQGLYSDDEANFVYSPISAYYALSLLVEAAQGETYDQLASALGITDIDTFRQDSRNLYQNLYYDFTIGEDAYEKVATSKIANGVFVNESAAVKQSYLDTLATEYYTEVFHTTFNAEAKRGIADWINDKTNNFLDVTPDDLEANSTTLFALYNTLYMKKSWNTRFLNDRTFKDNFTTTASGETQNGDFMHGDQYTPYFVHTEYRSISKTFFQGGKVIFVLPNATYLPSDILASDTLVRQILNEMKSPAVDDYVMASIALPKTKVIQKHDLEPALEGQGVTAAFDITRADLSRAVDDAYLETLTQKVGVEFNEDGSEAAAYTEATAGSTSSMPEDNGVSFVMDHSFLYFIVSPEGVPLFVGVTNTLD